MFFFGCRKRSKDFLYEAEWKSFLEDKTLTHFIVAFSRSALWNRICWFVILERWHFLSWYYCTYSIYSDQPQKVYVQHCMKQYSKEIWNLLHHEKACFYISGYLSFEFTCHWEAFIEWTHVHFVQKCYKNAAWCSSNTSRDHSDRRWIFSRGEWAVSSHSRTH